MTMTSSDWKEVIGVPIFLGIFIYLFVLLAKGTERKISREIRNVTRQLPVPEKSQGILNTIMGLLAGAALMRIFVAGLSIFLIIGPGVVAHYFPYLNEQRKPSSEEYELVIWIIIGTITLANIPKSLAKVVIGLLLSLGLLHTLLT